MYARCWNGNLAIGTNRTQCRIEARARIRRVEKLRMNMNDHEVYIRPVESSDRRELLELSAKSKSLHGPWITPPLTPHSFRAYYKRTLRDDHEGMLCCLRGSDEIIGVINLNNIIHGTFLSASLGYYVSIDHAGRGLMTQGLGLVTKFAFVSLGLHRIEANIQPENEPSKRLVQRCGFTLEGFARGFLFIDGKWRDHERWSLVDERGGLAPNLPFSLVR